jgi:hypothetical protein
MELLIFRHCETIGRAIGMDAIIDKIKKKEKKDGANPILR